MLRILGGKRLLNEILNEYLKEIYEYNSKLPKGVVLKPFHYVNSKGRKYVYLGRYFYKYETIGGKVRWRYIGKEVPKDFPPPPPNPLEGVRFEVDGDYLILSERDLERNPLLKDILKKRFGERTLGTSRDGRGVE